MTRKFNKDQSHFHHNYSLVILAGPGSHHPHAAHEAPVVVLAGDVHLPVLPVAPRHPVGARRETRLVDRVLLRFAVDFRAGEERVEAGVVLADAAHELVVGALELLRQYSVGIACSESEWIDESSETCNSSLDRLLFSMTIPTLSIFHVEFLLLLKVSAGQLAYF